MTTISPSPSSSRKRTIKQRVDESVLKKARAALGLSVVDHDDEDDKKEEPSLKWRKPRHNTAEGQLYVKNKKRRQLEEEPESDVSKSPATSKEEKKGKKKSRRDKKKKKKGTASDKQPSVKNPDSEKRHGLEAISYLQLWATNRDHWKFEKLKQMWLLKNCLNEGLVDEPRFELLLEYISSIKGVAKQSTRREMESIISSYENNSSSEITSIMYERARQIIQMLTDD